MTQNNISRLESPDYGSRSITSLKRIASALDVALVVRLVPFSQYIDWLSGTPHMDMGLSEQSLAPSSFEAENAAGVFEQTAGRFWEVVEGGAAKAMSGIENANTRLDRELIYGIGSGNESQSIGDDGIGLTDQRRENSDRRLRGVLGNEVRLQKVPLSA